MSEQKPRRNVIEPRREFICGMIMPSVTAGGVLAVQAGDVQAFMQHSRQSTMPLAQLAMKVRKRKTQEPKQ